MRHKRTRTWPIGRGADPSAEIRNGLPRREEASWRLDLSPPSGRCSLGDQHVQGAALSDQEDQARRDQVLVARVRSSAEERALALIAARADEGRNPRPGPLVLELLRRSILDNTGDANLAWSAMFIGTLADIAAQALQLLPDGDDLLAEMDVALLLQTAEIAAHGGETFGSKDQG